MVSALLHEIQRDAKHLSCAKAAKGGKEGASKGSAAAATSGAADAALREAMEARTLDGLMDAIHANADGASPALLDEARALRDDLRTQKKLRALEEGRKRPDEAASSATALLRWAPTTALWARISHLRARRSSTELASAAASPGTSPATPSSAPEAQFDNMAELREVLATPATPASAEPSRTSAATLSSLREFMADEAAATRDADDSLRAAMAVGTLESLMDVIHSRGSHATPEVL